MLSLILILILIEYYSPFSDEQPCAIKQGDNLVEFFKDEINKPNLFI